jgi:hypothetical protein
MINTRDPISELLAKVHAMQSQIESLRSIERPVACRWRGSSAGAPANIREGDVYYDTGAGEVYIYANSVSRQIS